MNTKQAVAKLQNIAGVFQAAKDLEEIFAQAASLDNAIEERKAALAEQDKALADLKGKVDEATAAEAARSLAAETAYAERTAKINAEFEALVEGFEFAKKEMARDTASALAARDAVGDAFATEIREMTQTRDRLSQAVEQLKAEFAALKDRAAKV